jgi:hypothetical protein
MTGRYPTTRIQLKHRRSKNFETRYLDLSSSELGQVKGSCEQVNESSGSKKGEEFRDLFSDCQLLKNDSSPGN